MIYAYLFRDNTDTDNGVITDDHTLLIISYGPSVSSNTGGAFQPSTQLITLRPQQLTQGRKHQQAMCHYMHMVIELVHVVCIFNKEKLFWLMNHYYSLI